MGLENSYFLTFSKLICIHLRIFFFFGSQLPANSNNWRTEEEVLVRYQLSGYLLTTLKAPNIDERLNLCQVGSEIASTYNSRDLL